jgi:cytochrome d ubiquinol oxidase subunit II
MILTIIFILAFTLTCFAVFGGADLGSGIVEFMQTKRSDIAAKENCTTQALQPVWEINHIWLVLSIMIIFIVFPLAFFKIFTTFIVPVMALIIGLLVRGYAFTLKAHTDTPSAITNRIFGPSSTWSAFWMGNLVGAIIQGKISQNATGIYQEYIGPWLSLFPIFTGLFLVVLFGYIGAVFLMAECQKDEVFDILKRKAKQFNIAAIIIGALVLVSAYFTEESMTFYFLQSKVSLTSFGLATMLLVPHWFAISKKIKFLMQATVVAQMVLILTGLFGAQYPIILQTNLDRIPKTYTFINSMAKDSNPPVLMGVAIIAFLITIPVFIYMYKVYQKKMHHGHEG